MVKASVKSRRKTPPGKASRAASKGAGKTRKKPRPAG